MSDRIKTLEKYREMEAGALLKEEGELPQRHLEVEDPEGHRADRRPAEIGDREEGLGAPDDRSARARDGGHRRRAKLKEATHGGDQDQAAGIQDRRGRVRQGGQDRRRAGGPHRQARFVQAVRTAQDAVRGARRDERLPDRRHRRDRGVAPAVRAQAVAGAPGDEAGPGHVAGGGRVTGDRNRRTRSFS